MVTPEGVKPNPKKIQAIQALQRPTTVTEVRSFIGMVQYYRDLWPRRSHILQPFTEVSAGKKGTKNKMDRRIGVLLPSGKKDGLSADNVNLPRLE